MGGAGVMCRGARSLPQLPASAVSKPGDALFSRVDAGDLNRELGEQMGGLSAKVPCPRPAADPPPSPRMPSR